ncbi:hypothetical protein CR513_00762, partial [Mucuna pruriens]
MTPPQRENQLNSDKHISTLRGLHECEVQLKPVKGWVQRFHSSRLSVFCSVLMLRLVSVAHLYNLSSLLDLKADGFGRDPVRLGSKAPFSSLSEGFQASFFLCSSYILSSLGALSPPFISSFICNDFHQHLPILYKKLIETANYSTWAAIVYLWFQGQGHSRIFPLEINPVGSKLTPYAASSSSLSLPTFSLNSRHFLLVMRSGPRPKKYSPMMSIVSTMW